MLKNFNIYVPGGYSFEKDLLPRIKNPILEFFPVNARRYGVQREGNNHLVVFLDFCLKKDPAKFAEAEEGESGAFNLKNPTETEIFNALFSAQKEVSVYTVSYHPRMSAIAWKLLIDILDDEKIMVEDDSGNFMRGPHCVKELKALYGKA
jgi:hypothetical protein